MKHNKGIITTGVIATVLILSGCTQQQENTGIGAGLGAAAGAGIGAIANGGSGAAVGAAIGAAAGGVAGALFPTDENN